MLHSCDAGEMSVITAYPPGFKMSNPEDGYSAVELLTGYIPVMRYYNIGEEGGDRMPVNGIR